MKSVLLRTASGRPPSFDRGARTPLHCDPGCTNPLTQCFVRPRLFPAGHVKTGALPKTHVKVKARFSRRVFGAMVSLFPRAIGSRAHHFLAILFMCILTVRPVQSNGLFVPKDIERWLTDFVLKLKTQGLPGTIA
ncbi:regulatory sensor-transducer, BlaR1/MecR1 family [Anopheles sinensis]|uniref:Regulatory sensor-transducer, BlaR1/MecR1 family n=1 Tax=Anopheles sinensis TaxID=74873 RepID=A0A084VUX4_ANOSI|nr:regulatory sensor-transducer, BlaR1/MecR1 family [Anopheles sinensis]